MGQTFDRVLRRLEDKDPELKILDLTTTRINYYSLVEALAGNNIVEELEIEDEEMDYDISEGLAENFLRDNATLTKLSLPANCIDRDFLSFLLDAFKTMTKLTILDLRGNEICYRNLNYEDYSAIEDFSDALNDMPPSLIEIDLGQNHIEDEGAIALAEALKANKTLKTLHLYSCRIGDLGVKALIEIFETNTTLTKLDLSYNECNPELIEDINTGLKKNVELEALGEVQQMDAEVQKY